MFPDLFGDSRLSSLAPAFTVTEGDRVAQLILERIVTPEVVEVEVSLAP